MKYKCRLCGEVFDDKKEAEKHIREEHFVKSSLIEEIGE